MLAELLATARAAGWRVAAHNDFLQGGQWLTFWLFTHPDGQWVQGEGRTDEDAVRSAMREMGL